jgi:DNA-binding MarR family transcriptional regulator
LIVRSGVEGDQRAATLRLTSAGAQLLARVEAELIRRLDGLLERTPDRERVLESLEWLGDAIEQARSQHPAGPGQAGT